MNKEFDNQCSSHKILECEYKRNINNNLENRKEEKRKKFDFVQRKENAICSLFEVENFLCSLQKVINTFKFYHSIKK